ncbi:hypothetical protein SUGI_1067370 [Cryptomeria japonica]|nr:hypothetical protein SUGI_1067370 [Cryptomeria japonica]
MGKRVASRWCHGNAVQDVAPDERHRGNINFDHVGYWQMASWRAVGEITTPNALFQQAKNKFKRPFKSIGNRLLTRLLEILLSKLSRTKFSYAPSTYYVSKEKMEGGRAWILADGHGITVGAESELIPMEDSKEESEE